MSIILWRRSNFLKLARSNSKRLNFLNEKQQKHHYDHLLVALSYLPRPNNQICKNIHHYPIIDIYIISPLYSRKIWPLFVYSARVRLSESHPALFQQCCLKLKHWRGCNTRFEQLRNLASGFLDSRTNCSCWPTVFWVISGLVFVLVLEISWLEKSDIISLRFWKSYARRESYTCVATWCLCSFPVKPHLKYKPQELNLESYNPDIVE